MHCLTLHNISQKQKRREVVAIEKGSRKQEVQFCLLIKMPPPPHPMPMPMDPATYGVSVIFHFIFLRKKKRKRENL